MAAAEQRRALDGFGSVDLTPLRAARARVAELDAELATFGGDARARAREMDLLRYQVDELDAAAIEDPDEDGTLEAEEDRLADATAHREAAAVAVETLAGEAGALDAVGTARAALSGRSPFGGLEQRLRAVEAELADIGSELRQTAEAIADDPDRLAAVRARRHLLRELTRKYGETLDEVVAYRDEARARLDELASHDERALALDQARRAALAECDTAAAHVASARRPRRAEARRSRAAASSRARFAARKVERRRRRRRSR